MWKQQCFSALNQKLMLPDNTSHTSMYLLTEEGKEDAKEIFLQSHSLVKVLTTLIFVKAIGKDSESRSLQ